MKNTPKRLLLFFVGVPALAAMIWFLPHHGHLAVMISLTLLAAFGSLEIRSLIGRITKTPPIGSMVFGTLFPITSWSVEMGFLPAGAVEILSLLGFLWALSGPIFTRETELKDALIRMGTGLIQVFYPGWFLMWIARMNFLSESRSVLIIFMLTVFLNDSAAWLFGKLFGKHRNLTAVSPQKSLEGFLGGAMASVLVVVIAGFLAPRAIPLNTGLRIMLGLTAAAAVIAGDLIESAIKRSAGVKDSGKAIMGRGGVLDSIDSLLFAGPIFVLFLK